ncbi:aspartic proteinase Asp1 isoform X2 [Andrographis paniculata]|uniref:aspartic proteinase Asp1 isoform X2 n=1 Tax=Andrographis paniculata TaxID=175694 RepID=UPI0021E7216C|nr:aspartic proteinase Asp1 isoform X2 [Andrographis paniculata]
MQTVSPRDRYEYTSRSKGEKNWFYFAQVYVGYPPRPYFLDPDTGSDLTWLQCDAPCVRCTTGFHPLYRPSNDLVVCRDPVCASLHSGDYTCDTPEQCDYEVEYADGGSSLGVLVNDFFALNLTTGSRMSPRLTLGCGYDQLPGASEHPLDGVLGLGRGKSSIVSQLHDQGVVKNIVGHCLNSQGGFLFFGDDVYDPSRVTWTPMSRDDPKHYSAGPAELRFGGRSTGFKNLNVIFDSGSSYTYFTSQIYHTLLSLIKKEVNGKSLNEATDDYTLPVCWKGKKPFKTTREVRKYFKSLALVFASSWRSKVQYEISPESYLIISSKGNACLGILNGTDIGLSNFNMIGDISMQDRLVIYDNERQRMGWTPANCDQPPKFRSVM